MGKLDQKRKAVLIFVGIGVIICLIIGGQHKSAQTPVPVEAKPEDTKVITNAVVAPTPTAVDDKPVVKFIIYRDDVAQNHYDLSGYMPSGKCVTANVSWKENCQEGQKCLRIDYDSECSSKEEGWAGAYWLEPANNWGSEKGGYNLTGSQKLVFWARGEKGGEIIESFKVGGITGDNYKFPDTATASIGPVTLTSQWQQYSIDLKDKDLTYIGGGFAWIVTAQANPKPITFYLDDIHFE